MVVGILANHKAAEDGRLGRVVEGGSFFLRWCDQQAAVPSLAEGRASELVGELLMQIGLAGPTAYIRAEDYIIRALNVFVAAKRTRQITSDTTREQLLLRTPHTHGLMALSELRFGHLRTDHARLELRKAVSAASSLTTARSRDLRLGWLHQVSAAAARSRARLLEAHKASEVVQQHYSKAGRRARARLANTYSSEQKARRAARQRTRAVAGAALSKH
jgi:hypothetical protein